MIADVITRLGEAKVGNVKLFKVIEGAAGFAKASETKPTASPAVYVLPLNKGAEKNKADDFVLQWVKPAFGIAIALSNVSDRKGEAALIDVESACKEVEKVLLGWVPRSDCKPMEYGGGALLGFRNGVLWWQEIYGTEHLIQS